jgi:V8-like Glu-specific endopeptidase
MADVLDEMVAPSVVTNTKGIKTAAPTGGDGTLQFGERHGDVLAAVRPPKATAKRIEAGAEAHEEVGPDPAEATEEFVEATPAQLATGGAEAGEETALSDLKAEGYEGRLETGAEGSIIEAGAAVQGAQPEFFGFLAALVPTLISSVGPAIVKAVSKKLSPKTKAAIKTIAKRAPVLNGPIGTVATQVGSTHGVSGLIPLIAKLFEAAEASDGGVAGEAGEEGAGVDEAVVAETVAVMETIIGTDDRLRVTNTTNEPWRWYCALRIYFPSGAQYRGTGFFIGPRAVATAGHCVYMKGQGGWARKIEVIPGCNGAQHPLGSAMATEFRSTSGYVENSLPECDYGCIFLPSGAFGGTSVGSFGAAAFDTQVLLAQDAVLAGYPGDKPFAEFWGMAARIKTVAAKTLIYDIDTMGGQSGAPVYIKRNGVRYVVGIHNYGAGTGNSATRVTVPVYQRLLAWSKM